MFNRKLIKFNGHHLVIATVYCGYVFVYVCAYSMHTAQHASNYYYFVRSLNWSWIVPFCIIFWMLIRVKSTNFSSSVLCLFLFACSPVQCHQHCWFTIKSSWNTCSCSYIYLTFYMHIWTNGRTNEWMWKVWWCLSLVSKNWGVAWLYVYKMVIF